MIKGAHRPVGTRQQKHQDELSIGVFEIDAGSCRVKGFSRSRFITRFVCVCMCVCVCVCVCVYACVCVWSCCVKGFSRSSFE